jgi:hypothetical protein
MRRYNTRRTQHNFKTTSAHSIANNNFAIVGTREWNALPDAIKALTSKDSFKTNIKKYLRAQAHYNESRDYLYY